jgi:hypothetical protein
MTRFYISLLVVIIGCSLTTETFAQSTFSQVQSLLQTNCGASGCHGGGNAVVFDVDASETDLYNSIVGVQPTNQMALDKGEMLVDAGHPYNSFLLKKIYDSIDGYYPLHADEGMAEPRNTNPLEKTEIELVRQWILAGAPQSGNVVDQQLVADYYSGGHDPFMDIPTPPAVEDGFQIRSGPYFLEPQTEFEYIKKEYLHNTEELKIKRLDGFMSDLSHHLLLFKYVDDASSVSQGMRAVPSAAVPFDPLTSLSASWADPASFDLPQGTAYYWDADAVLDVNYHNVNASTTSIHPSDFYMNAYYYDDPVEPIEMHAEIDNNPALLLFQGENTVVSQHVPGGEERYLWMLASHTHKYGTDFDTYRRTPDGERGEQIYEGFYDSEYDFNQGYYDWEHPAVRYFEPFEMFDANLGLEFETKWNVAEPFITFGLTTNDEMMLLSYLYTTVDPASVGIEESISDLTGVAVYPNPVVDELNIKLELDRSANVQIVIKDLLGREVALLVNEKMNVGKYSLSESLSAYNISGVFFLDFMLDGIKVETKKLIAVNSN